MQKNYFRKIDRCRPLLISQEARYIKGYRLPITVGFTGRPDNKGTERFFIYLYRLANFVFHRTTR